jgi:hypothetical protein
MSIMVLALTIVLSLLAPSPVLAGDGDWQQWSEASWIQTLGSGFDVGMRWEGRWEEDVSRFAYYEVEPMLVWRYSPRWDFGIGYERDERIAPAEEIDHVPNISATLRIPRQPFRIIPTLDWRASNRSRMDFMVPEEDDMDWRPVYRNRTDLEARWKWGSKELVPFLFEEWFVDVDHGGFSQNRFGVGIGVPIVPHWMARAYWMRLDEKIQGAWEWHPVVGVQIEAQF